MKGLVLIVFMLLSLSAVCYPGDSTRVADRQRDKNERLIEREKEKIERQRRRIEKRWDQRSREQKKTDRRAILFLVISAGLLVNTMAVRE